MSKSGEGRTCCGIVAGESAAGENAVGENAVGENAGGENAAGENAAGENAGGENAGGENADGENADGGDVCRSRGPAAGAACCGIAALWLLAAVFPVPVLPVAVAHGEEPAALADSRRKAISYLEQEVDRWAQKGECFSCHNSGDGARVLHVAAGRGLTVNRVKLEATTAWLLTPEAWDDNGPEGEFSDKQLARLQFASALAATVGSEESASNGKRQAAEQDALLRAAALLIADQQADGAWHVGGTDTIGSPITYGSFLSTAQAMGVLRRANKRRFAGPLEAAREWVLGEQPRSVLNAAATLLALGPDAGPGAAARRRECRELIRRGQAPDGGWGPYVTAPTEPFDTSVVVLALAGDDDPASRAMWRRGRSFLLSTQLADGSWPETTRPAERESYAHRVSTTAWALLALLPLEAAPR